VITPVDSDGARLGRPPTREEIDQIVPLFFSECERATLAEHPQADSVHVMRFIDAPVSRERTPKQIAAARRKQQQRQRERERREQRDEDHTRRDMSHEEPGAGAPDDAVEPETGP